MAYDNHTGTEPALLTSKAASETGRVLQAIAKKNLPTITANDAGYTIPADLNIGKIGWGHNNAVESALRIESQQTGPGTWRD